MKLRDVGEFGLIDRIRQIVHLPAEDLLIGIDDDAAAFQIAKDHILLLTTDALVEGVHFDLSYFTYYQVGWRALAANLSDIAAMGGWPKFAVVALGLPDHQEVEPVEELYHGMKSLADEFNTIIVGGDTTRSPDRLVVNVAVVGEVEPGKLTPRAGAQPGDALLVTGSLGGSQAGLTILRSRHRAPREAFATLTEQHLVPRPRIEEARWLVKHFDIHAMIDISDGLASEAHHIGKQSGVGLKLLEESIPIDSDTRKAAEHFGESALEYALYGGEDYELLFAVPMSVESTLLRAFRQEFGRACTRVGQVVDASEGITLRTTDGKRIPVRFRGYDHFK